MEVFMAVDDQAAGAEASRSLQIWELIPKTTLGKNLRMEKLSRLSAKVSKKGGQRQPY
jgi:hypothetical protein